MSPWPIAGPTIFPTGFTPRARNSSRPTPTRNSFLRSSGNTIRPVFSRTSFISPTDLPRRRQTSPRNCGPENGDDVLLHQFREFRSDGVGPDLITGGIRVQEIGHDFGGHRVFALEEFVADVQ